MDNSIVSGGVRPVRLDGDNVESVLRDKLRRDLGPRIIELRCPMRRLAEHNDPPVAEETSRYGAQIRHQVERQRSLPQLVADVAGRAIARFDGELGNGTNGTERYRLRIPNLRGHAQRVPRRPGVVLHHRWPFSRTDERHKRHQAVLFLLEGVFACAPDARQHLVRRAADGDD